MGCINQSKKATKGQNQLLQRIFAAAGPNTPEKAIGLYIFGTGRGGQAVRQYLEQCDANIAIKGFFDNNASKQGLLDGVLVTAPSEELIRLGDIIIIASLTHCNEMEEQLLKLGLDKEKIILPGGWLKSLFTDVSVQFNEEEKRQAENFAKELQVVPDIHPDDFIFRFVYDSVGGQTKKDAIQFYFYDGNRSAKKLYDILFSYLELKQDISLLEFASGYGCVTRHLVKMLDNVNLTACDIHDEAIQFIREKIKAKALISTHIPEELCVGSYDVVFALSFFSHMPKLSWSRWFAALLKQTSDDGYLIFTTHGEISNKLYLRGTFDNEGFYFLPDSEQMDLDSAVYGTAATTYKFVSNVIAANKCKLKMFAEGYWWGHQDLYIVQKCC